MASSLVWGSSSSNVHELPGHRAVGLTPKQWHYVFANTISEEEAEPIYERYAVPAASDVLADVALANLHRNPPTEVDFARIAAVIVRLVDVLLAIHATRRLSRCARCRLPSPT